MTFATATRMAIGAGLLLAAGAATSVQAQTETRTVRERVVVTLPSGKRIVRMVEKQVPVVTETADPSPSDPFAGGGDEGGDTRVEAPGDELADLDPRLLEWLEWFRQGDSRADANGDGRISPADLNAYLIYLNGQPDGGDDGDAGDPPPPDPNANGGTTDGGSVDGGGDDDGSDDTTDDNSGDTNDTTGWTELVPSSDSMVFYVAENGNDSNDGLSPTRPLRTVAEGVRRLRDGRPDWLLLRRGDSWSEPLSTSWKKSGRSSSEPMVVSAYGEGPRPRLITGSTSGLSVLNTETREHLAFVSLHLQPGVPYQKTGMNFVGGNIRDVLIEDCLIEDYRVGMTMQGFNGRLSDFRVRRNVIVDAGGDSHSQGVFSSNTDGLLIEENIFDRNGWRADQGRDATAGIFAHNLYIQRTNTDVVFRNNWTSRAAAEGYKSRAGGVVDGNIFWQNPIAVSFGNDGTNRDDRSVTGSINDNVVLESNDISSDHPRGWGIRIENTASAEAKRNIIANALSDRGFGIAVRSERDRGTCDNLVIADNIIDDHGDGIEIDRDLVIDVDVLSNISTASSGDEFLMRLRGSGTNALEIEGNLYRHTAENEPLQSGASSLTIDEWQASYDPMGGAALSPFRKQDATMNDFARSIGMSGTDELLQALRSQRKGAWNPQLSASSVRAYFEWAFEPQG